MGKHDHHEHHGESLADAARHNLEAAGEKWTETRAAIFEALAGFSRPASAYDIAELVSAARGKRVAPNSVYRILDLFVAKNLAMRVESANAYLANSHPGCEHDCMFLVCDTCGEATHIDDDALSAKVRGVAQEQGFSSIRPVIEVRGICQKCS
ncbi:transcriptional repressor [Sphingorhabdus sp. Alg231-15]|uniref:transcriptional repressor n=1 Tax=Sphingorhabdus sp. Alg231-15 TaxID=1922222 RepID=UPI000D55A4BA